MASKEKGRAKKHHSASSTAPKVSVVVPVCNVERYLPACLDSLQGQTLRELEILLVDDGSTDGCPQLLAKAAKHDARMRVITKPNGGYGSAVNAGLDQARGRYVGIVEPDDFVDPRMFEELLAAAKLEDGTWADVVKSSYWNYYDLEDGSEPYIEAPDLMEKMPATPYAFNVHDDNMVLMQHPSIWSAIYRRDFLEEHDIRLVEAPGGGWVDNPFLFETLVQAKTILWVPSAFYYYRQTNPHSSSYLLDYRIPFQRLGDIRAILARLGETNSNVLAALYNRTFDYIKSVPEKYGFDEGDPEVFALIKEALESMDRSVLYSGARGIRADYLNYYEDVMGITARKVKTHARSSKPKASVVLSLKDVRPFVIPCLRSLTEQTLEAFEVIVIDCGSRDRSATVAEYFSRKDGRFLVLRAGDRTVPEGMALGASLASGDVMVFADVRTTFKKKLLAHVVRAFNECPRADLLLYASKFEYLPKKLPEGKKLAENHAADFEAEGLRDRLMVAAPNEVAGKAMRASFYRGIEQPFCAQEGARGALTSTKAIAQASRVALMKESSVERQAYRHTRTALAYAQRRPVAEDLRKADFPLVADYAARCGDEEIRRGFYCHAVEAILDDLDDMGSLEDERAYLAALNEECLEPYKLLDQPQSTFVNADSYHRLQRLSRMNPERYLEQETAKSRDKAKKISESTAYRTGKKIAALGPRLLPGSLAGSVKKIL